VLWLIFYNEVDDIHQAMEINGDNEDSINEHNLYLNKRIISHLFNAPALRKLEFTNFDLQISDFEVIHTSLPQLESLTIRSSTLRGDELPDGVIPTDSLKKLSLVLISINSLSLSNMIRYMIKKYTCLQELIIDPCYDSFVLEIHLPPDSFVQETDANAIMTKFSKQLTTLKLPIKSGFVKWVCGFDCQLSAFTIDKRNSTQSTLETLSRFPQRAFLKELSILCPFYFDPAPLKELSHLKKLCISCRGMTQDSNTDIVSVLRCCSDHLTSLILYWVALQDTLAMNHIFALQELKIYSDSLPKQLDLFLSKCCPRLRSLTLSRCFSAGDHLNLSELSLSYLKIQLSYPRVKGQPMQDFPSHPKTLFLVVTPKTEQLYYVDGCNDIGTREVFSGKKIYHLRYKTCFPIKPANLPVMEMTALYCRSVDTLIINDRIAC
jgi:hypothetical protein